MHKGIAPVVSVTILTLIIVTTALSFTLFLQNQQEQITGRLDLQNAVQVQSTRCNGNTVSFLIENNGTQYLEIDTADLFVFDNGNINHSFSKQDLDVTETYQIPGRTGYLNITAGNVFQSGDVYRIHLDYDGTDFQIQQDCRAGLEWWDLNWDYRRQISVQNPESTTKNNVATYVELNTADLISQNKLNTGCTDIRVVEQTETVQYNVTNCNTPNTRIYFQNDINSSDTEYDTYLYHGNLQAQDASGSPGTVDTSLTASLKTEERR